MTAATAKRVAAALVATLMLSGCASLAAEREPRVLLFSHSTGYRHASIEPGIAAMKVLGDREGMAVVASEDPSLFSAEGLKAFDAIVLLSTTTDAKNPASEWFQGSRREALQGFVRRGGGIVGVHAAADSHYHWPWYTRMLGGRFARHPPGAPEGALRVLNHDHPATRGLAPVIRRADEWYYFEDFNPEAEVLVTLDPASIGEADVNPNPISWAHAFEGGRVFYTAMGHTAESYADPVFLRHLSGGLAWVLDRPSPE